MPNIADPFRISIHCHAYPDSALMSLHTLQLAANITYIYTLTLTLSLHYKPKSPS